MLDIILATKASKEIEALQYGDLYLRNSILHKYWMESDAKEFSTFEKLVDQMLGVEEVVKPVNKKKKAGFFSRFFH